jgi:hypothetical protein
MKNTKTQLDSVSVGFSVGVFLAPPKCGASANRHVRVINASFSGLHSQTERRLFGPT